MKTKDIFWVLFISMLPIVELRGAIPVGCGLGLPYHINFALAVCGNLLPVPFILLLIPYVLDLMERFNIFRPIVQWVRKKAVKYRGKIVVEEPCFPVTDGAETDNSIECNASLRKTKITRGAFFGLLLFVLLPLPGTGAWTGALVASLFNFPKLKSFLAILLGVLGCGVLVSLISYGVLEFLAFLI
ncbi:MAG: small multidrug export protein [Ruminococcaceae bacterium]|nr:small multidrug export protein [Oscillospiraceae bacterium]